MEQKDINSKIKLLYTRNFKRDLDIVIFKAIINGKKYNEISINDFKIDDKNINIYTYAWQLKKGKAIKHLDVSKIDEDHYKFMDSLKKEKIYEHLLNEYKLPFEEVSYKNTIKNLFNNNTYNNSPQCHYCGITEAIINDIIIETEYNIDSTMRFHTKRFYNRGLSMEIDQIKPSMGYVEDNMVLCCYWCNNAKSDEFSYHEFKLFIAPSIRKIWKSRFGIILPLPNYPIKVHIKILNALFEIRNKLFSLLRK